MSDTPPPVPDNFIALPFGDGVYTFKLGCKQIAELQTKCDAGVGLIVARIMAGRYVDMRTGKAATNLMEARFKHEDVRETIRLALIGGNQGEVKGESTDVSPIKAENLCRHYVDDRPLQESWTVAAAILSALVNGFSDPDKPAAQKKMPDEVTADEPEKVGSTTM